MELHHTRLHIVRLAHIQPDALTLQAGLVGHFYGIKGQGSQVDIQCGAVPADNAKQVRVTKANLKRTTLRPG